MLAGTIYAAGPSTTMVLPGLDFETYSEAGHRAELDPKTGLIKWKMPIGAGGTKRGLPVVGVKNYVNHPTFDILSLVYDLKDGNGEHEWRKPRDLKHISTGDTRHPWELLNHVAAGGSLAGWNAGGFEYTVWNDYCVPVLGWPVLRLETVYCTMAKGRTWAMPGKLKDAGGVLRLVWQKDKAGEDLLKKFSEPRNQTKTDPRTRITLDDDPNDANRLLRYNAIDVRSEGEASTRMPDLSPLERQYWLMDQRINHRGLGVDVDGVENCIAVLEQTQDKYNRELYQLTGGAVEDSDKLPALRAWCATMGVHLPNMQAETIDDEVKRLFAAGVKSLDGTMRGMALRALEIRQALGSAAVKKLYAFRHTQYMGRLYDLYQYWAARTGRWTGNGPQPQNLVKPLPFFENFSEVEKALKVLAYRDVSYVEACYPEFSPLDVICSVLRSLLCAAPGHDLICSDFSAIEGVVTAALAGEDWALQVYRTHGMIYEATASTITGIPFEEFVKHREQTGGTVLRDAMGNILGIKGGKHHPLRNKQGKFGALASGFGGWIQAWKNFGADEYMSDTEIRDAIVAWREKSPATVELWGGQSRPIDPRRNKPWDPQRKEYFGLEGAAVQAVLNPGQCFTYRYISYQMHGDVLYCQLPSGRLLTYHAPRLEPHKRFDSSPDWEVQLSYEGWNSNPQQGPLGWIRMDLYGGKLTENVVQAVARDLQANAMLNVEAAGYPIVLHSHDEIAGEVPEGFGSVEDFESHANRLPEWARMPDGSWWPVRMKGGWRGKRYRKD